MADQFFERKLRRNAGIPARRVGNDGARERLRNGLEFNVKVIRFQQPVLAMVPPIQRNPVHGAFRERKFLGDVARQPDARNHWMFEPRAKRRSCLVKVAARIIFLEGCGAQDNAIDFDRGPRWIAGDLQLFRERARGAGE